MKIECPRARETDISARGPSNTTWVGSTLGLTLLKSNKSCFCCRHRLGLKSHSRLKRVRAPPQPPTNRFWSSRIEKYDFESISDEKFFFPLFFIREELEGPRSPKFLPATNRAKYAYIRCAPKIGNIWPLKTSITKSCFGIYFQSLSDFVLGAIK